jgi:hypothetical protein
MPSKHEHNHRFTKNQKKKKKQKKDDDEDGNPKKNNTSKIWNQEEELSLVFI